MPDLWGFAGAVLKWALYLGVLGASGTVLCRAVLRLPHVAWIAFGFAFLGLLAAVLSFMIKGMALTGTVSGMVDPEMLGLLWQSQNGTVLLAQCGGLLLLIAGLALGRFGTGPAMLGGLIALSSFVFVGHVPDHGGPILQGVLVLHLVGVAFWIGILIPLKRLSLTPGSLAMAADVGHRFGRIAVVGVPILLIAGIVMAYVLVGSWLALFTTPYGQTLLVKMGAVAVLLGLAAFNKLRYVPALLQGDRAAADQLATSIRLEIWVIAFIFGATAVLTSFLTLPMQHG